MSTEVAERLRFVRNKHGLSQRELAKRAGVTNGAISLIDLAVALYAFYGKKLQGVWRATYVVTALIALWFNVFVLIVQLFIKLPDPPVTGGPLFGATQGAVLLAFVAAGWLALKAFRPAPDCS